jgi:hypothetical protein
MRSFKLPILYYLLDLHTLFEAGCSRLNIFNYTDIHKYHTILYLDTDILVNSDINTLLNLEISSEKIYALEEGVISDDYWGSLFFDFSKYDRNTTAFTSGILLFKNSDCMKLLFDTINSHISDFIYDKKNPIPVCLDQPFIVYNAVSQKKYDNQLIKSYVENNPSILSLEKIVYHFPGGPGFYDSKYSKMLGFWRLIDKTKIKTILDKKKYSWGYDSITFLEGGMMDAFGKGNYAQIDTYKFVANFGCKEHSLLFSNDYKEFTSTRIGDGMIVKGKLIK